MYDFLKAICQPYLITLLMMGGLMIGARRRGKFTGRWFVLTIGVWGATVLFSLPVFGKLCLATLEWRHPPDVAAPSHVGAIVILGGGVGPPNIYRSYSEVTGSSFGRCVHSAALYRNCDRPKVIVCGGHTDPDPKCLSEAEAMCNALVRLGVDADDIILEDKSFNTYENACNVAKLLEDHRWESVILVTHARHMPRAVMCFRKQGVSLTASPFAGKAVFQPPYHELFIPSVSGLEASQQACYEWLGILWYRLKGKI